MLHDIGERITHVYFPLTALISLMTLLEDGTAVEVAAVGHEGMAGIPLALGIERDAHQALVQVPGDALRMEAAALRAAVDALPELRGMLLRYMQVLLVQVGQGSACNGKHGLSERCARWLLETHDRVRRDEFPLTQDFLASMLGVRRPAVTVAAGMLQQAGLITYHRGRVTVRDRAQLEAASCECYQVIATYTARLLGSAGGTE